MSWQEAGGSVAVPESVNSALEQFWARRASQQEKQRLKGSLDAGLRGAATGGKHLDGVRDAIAEVFVAAGIPSSAIRRDTALALPGFYRPSKNWDLLVIHQDILVAAIELKSHVGPSFSNNYNNRVEEALGNAADIWRAFEEGTLGDIRPWLGYVMVLEEAKKSTSPVKIDGTPFPPEPIFVGESYKGRYAILCDRLIKERLYDAAWFVTTNSSGVVDEPRDSVNFANFTAAIAGRVAYVNALLEGR